MATLKRSAAPATDPAPVAGETPFAGLLRLTQRPQPLVAVRPEPDLELVEQVSLAFENDPPAPTANQALAFQVLNLVAQTSYQTARLTQLIGQDAALSASVLRAANSAAARGAQEIETLRDAVVRLGSQEVGRLASAAAARSLFEPGLQTQLHWVRAQLEACFVDALATARAAAELALSIRGISCDRVFLAAMLHDVGRPVALRCFAQLTQGRGNLPASLIDPVVDAVHVELGAKTHHRLDLPRTSALVCANHHELELPEGATFTELHVVRLVSALVRWRRAPESILQGQLEIDSSALALQMDAHALRALDTRVSEQLAARPLAA